MTNYISAMVALSRKVKQADIYKNYLQYKKPPRAAWRLLIFRFAQNYDMKTQLSTKFLS